MEKLPDLHQRAAAGTPGRQVIRFISRPITVQLEFDLCWEILNGLLLRRARLEELNKSVLDPESPVIEAALERIDRAEKAIRTAAGLGDL